MEVEHKPPTAGRMGVEVTTVVCFPFADLASIRAIAAGVAGDHIHLVPGIDRDLEGLVVHLLQDTPTVLVVVHSAALVPERLEAVLGTFAKQRTRNQRLCVVEYAVSDRDRFLHEVAAAVEDMRGRLDVPVAERGVAAPVAAARRVSRARREVEPPRGDVAQGTEELAVPAFDLTTTDPGPSESGTTFPDLTSSVEHVRRGRAARAERDRSKRTLWVAVAAASVIVAAAWTLLQRPPTANDSVRSVVAVAPKQVAPVAPKPGPKPEAAKPKLVTPPAPLRASSSAAAAEARRVAAALDAGQVRALDALLVRSGPWDAESFADARKRCAKLEAGGLPGWRLPSLDELRALRRARLLPAGEYWSASRVEGPSLLTLARDVTRPRERGKDDMEHVRTLCVHQR